MKWVNGIRIINDIFDSFIEYEQLNEPQVGFIKRVLDSFHYGNHKLGLEEIEIFFKLQPDIFEKSLLNKFKERERTE